MTNRPEGRLRRARPDDAETVARIWWSGWQEAHVGHVPEELRVMRTGHSFRQRAADRIDEVILEEVSGGPVTGFVIVVENEVEQLYVDRAYRGTGVASRLLAEAEHRVSELGYGRAWLAVVAGNRAARRFYERHGWADEGDFQYEAATENGPVAVPCRRYSKSVDACVGS